MKTQIQKAVLITLLAILGVSTFDNSAGNLYKEINTDSELRRNYPLRNIVSWIRSHNLNDADRVEDIIVQNMCRLPPATGNYATVKQAWWHVPPMTNSAYEEITRRDRNRNHYYYVDRAISECGYVQPVVATWNGNGGLIIDNGFAGATGDLEDRANEILNERN